MAQEAQLFGNFLNLGLVFTEHSLHGFSDLGSFALNGIWKLTTKPVDKCIGVSYCQTVNQFYRLGGDNYLESQSSKFMTVPNAIYPDQYLPPDIESEDAYRTIVVVSRLTGRKGTPLMVATIEKLFKQPRYRHLKLLLAGDGPCMIQVEELREKYRWHDRITTLGSVQPSQVRSVLNQGRVFLRIRHISTSKL